MRLEGHFGDARPWHVAARKTLPCQAEAALRTSASTWQRSSLDWIADYTPTPAILLPPGNRAQQAIEPICICTFNADIALCAILLNALEAATLVEDNSALFDVEAAALDTLITAKPATYEGCARKAAAFLE